MHHYRVNVTGPASVVEAVVSELTSAGARSVEPGCLVMASEGGVEIWEALSVRHPAATLGLECFEAFEDERLHALVQNGHLTVMARAGVLRQDCGSFHDEDGQPLEKDLLRAAAEAVDAERLRADVATITTALDAALAIGGAIGRLCARVNSSRVHEPTRDQLDAVTELAVIALSVCSAARTVKEAEREFEDALRLTQSTVHAGLSELAERPGDADWREWLLILLSDASHVIDTSSHCDLEVESDATALGAEHCGTPREHLEVEASSLLTTILEVLALFDSDLAPTHSCRLMIYMKSTTIRVPAETRDRLNALARRWGAPAGEVIAALVKDADDRALLADAAASWERLASDPVALASYRAEADDLAGFDGPLPDY
jgi:predicted DNA-binding protein